MAESSPTQPKCDTQAAPSQPQAREGKVAGVTVSAGQPAASQGLVEVLSFMHRLSAFEKRSSQVNLLVR